MRTKPLETDYVRALLARAPLAIPTWRLFRRNVGLVRLDAERVFRAGIPGQCDLYAVSRGGRHAEIECKNVGGKLSEEQERWRAWCVEWGVPHVVLRVMKGEHPVETVERWISELKHMFATM